jgi:hypothetical protein
MTQIFVRMGALVLALTACSGGDASFSKDNNENTDVGGTGELGLYPEGGLVWEAVAPNLPCSQYMRIDSLAVQELIIDKIDITSSGGGVFTLPESHADIVLPQGESYEFRVQATITELVAAEGELRIRSNDAEVVDLRVTLSAFPVESWDSGTSEDPC